MKFVWAITGAGGTARVRVDEQLARLAERIAEFRA